MQLGVSILEIFQKMPGCVAKDTGFRVHLWLDHLPPYNMPNPANLQVEDITLEVGGLFRKQSMSQTHTLNAIVIVIVIVNGVQEWASEDLLEASTNWAMRTDILRMEIGNLGIGYFGIIFFKCRGTEGYMWMLMLLPRSHLDQSSPGDFSLKCLC